MPSAKLRAGLLSALPALDERTLKDLEALASQAELIEIRLTCTRIDHWWNRAHPRADRRRG